jgi:hypothetical protein
MILGSSGKSFGRVKLNRHRGSAAIPAIFRIPIRHAIDNIARAFKALLVD